MASSISDRLKQCQVDTWTTREQLCLASAVTRSGNQNWVAVSRTLRMLTTETDRPPDWYSTKNCALQYDKLLEQVDTPKRNREKGESNDTPGEIVAKMLSRKWVEEIEGILEEERATYQQLKRELQLMESNQCDSRLHQFWDQIIQEQEREDEEERRWNEWLKEREERIQIFQAASKQSLKGPVSSSHKTQQEKVTKKRISGETISEETSSLEEVDSEANQSALVSSPKCSSSRTSDSENPEKPQVSDAESVVYNESQSENSFQEFSGTGLKFEISSLSSTSDLLPDTLEVSSVDKIKDFMSDQSSVKAISQEDKGLKIQTTLKKEVSSCSMEFERGRDESPKETEPRTKIEIKLNVKPEKKQASITNYLKPLMNREKMEVVTHSTEEPLEDKSFVSQESILGKTLLSRGSIASDAEEDKVSSQKKFEDREIKKRLPRGQILASPDKKEGHLFVEQKPEFGKLKNESLDFKSLSKDAHQTKKMADIIEESGHNYAERCHPEEKDTEEDPDGWLLTRGGRKRKFLFSSPKEEERSKKLCLESSRVKKEELAGCSEDEKKESKEIKYVSSTSQLFIRKLESIEEMRKSKESVEETKSDHEDTKKMLKKEVKDEYEFDDDVSRESTDVRDFLISSRVERRKVPFLEGIASPVISESTPSSPASTSYGDDPEGEKQHRAWKRSIMLVWNDIAAHKNASIFLRPITEDKVPGYHSIVFRPIDLLTIKRNIESGHTRTTSDFQRDVMLMFLNAKMYNTSDHNIYQMAKEMMRDALDTLEEFIHAQMVARVDETPQKNLRRETRESSAKKTEEKKREDPREEKQIKRKK